MNKKLTFPKWFYKNWIKMNGEAHGVDVDNGNRGIRIRYRRAFLKHEERNGKSPKNDLTLEELADMVLNVQYCPVCGFDFNTYRTDEKKYNWEIAHIDPQGYFTLGNIQLLHSACNKAQYKDVVDFISFNGENGYNCFLDYVKILLKAGQIDSKNIQFKNYIRLIDRINNGFDPRTSNGR